MQDKTGPHIIVAMDYDNSAECLRVAQQLSPQQCRLKVGKELFTTAGPQLVEQLMGLGFEVFLDLKFHDIPNTTAKAVTAAANLGVWMINVHASGGERMLAAASNALAGFTSPPFLIAVTVLTSMESRDLHTLGIKDTPAQQVMRLAGLTQQCGLDGVVCSAHEARQLKRAYGQDFTLVTPGIRPADHATADDQRRTLTPREALLEGSDYLVIGRPITQAPDPASACEKILTHLHTPAE